MKILQRLLLAALLALAPIAPQLAHAAAPGTGALKAVLTQVYDPDAVAWKAKVVSQGATVSQVQLVRISTLDRAFKSRGLWTRLDRAFPLASENVTQAFTDLVSRSTATAVNSPTFTANQGVAGNGTSSYVNTNFAPLTNGVALSQNSGHVSIYDRTNNTTANGVSQIGGGDSGFAKLIALTIQPGTSPTVSFYVNQTTAGTIASQTTAQGFWIANRTGSLSGNQEMSRNSSVLTVTGQASTGLTAKPLFIDAFNNNGAAQSFVADQQAFVTIGGGLTTQNKIDLTSVVNAYITSLGTNVF